MFNMTSLLPLIEDILPMILPSSISVTKAKDVFPPKPVSSGPERKGEEAPGPQVISRNAVVDKTSKMCATGRLIPYHVPLPAPRQLACLSTCLPAGLGGGLYHGSGSASRHMTVIYYDSFQTWQYA